MNQSDEPAEDWIHLLHETDPFISAITDEKIADALVGFPLEPHESIKWLGRYIRWAVYFGIRLGGQAAERKRNIEIAKEIEAFSSKARKLYDDIWSISSDTEGALWNFA